MSVYPTGEVFPHGPVLANLMCFTLADTMQLKLVSVK